MSRTPLWPAVQLHRMHETFLKMNRSGTIFVAALNGSALGLGAEFAWPALPNVAERGSVRDLSD